jgi:hypothetical protein
LETKDWIVVVYDIVYGTIVGILDILEEVWNFVTNLPSQIAGLLDTLFDDLVEAINPLG